MSLSILIKRFLTGSAVPRTCNLESFMISLTNFVQEWGFFIGRSIADGMQARFDEIAEEERLDCDCGECEVDSILNGTDKEKKDDKAN